MNDVHYGWWLPPNIGGENAQGVDRLIYVVHFFMAVLFVGWGALFAYCLVRFRARPGETAVYEDIKAKPSKYAEIGVIVFEVFLLVALSMPIWASVKTKIPTGSDVVTVRCVAEQFAWNFHYPGADGEFGQSKATLVNTENPLGLDRSDPKAKDDLAVINTLHIPINKPVVIRGSSKDVIHSFYIPVLRAKSDLIPGMTVPIWFEAKKTGTYDIQCAQLCGNNHFKMKGQLFVDSSENFKKWLDEQAAAGAGGEEEEEE